MMVVMPIGTTLGEHFDMLTDSTGQGSNCQSSDPNPKMTALNPEPSPLETDPMLSNDYLITVLLSEL